MGQEKKSVTERDLAELKKEIAQKGKEIEQLKKTIEDLGTQIRGKARAGETEGLVRAFEDVSNLVDFGFSVFGTSGNVKSAKSKSKGLLGLINDLAELAEKSGTYQRTVNLGKRGVVDFRVSSRPITRSYTTKPRVHMKPSKPKKETSPTTGSIKEREPIVDIFEEGDQVRVMAELPGVEENQVNSDIDGNTLTIWADTPDTKYYKKLELPNSVRKDAVESSYRNGILEIRLEKT